MRTHRPRVTSKTAATERAPVLVLAQPSPETDDLLAPLVKRSDLVLFRVSDLNAAELALRDVAVSLVLVCPETEAPLVTAIVEQIDHVRPGIPVLALRPRSGDSQTAWKGRTIGVLRCPILPDVLSRTIDVALGLNVGHEATPKGSRERPPRA